MEAAGAAGTVTFKCGKQLQQHVGVNENQCSNESSVVLKQTKGFLSHLLKETCVRISSAQLDAASICKLIDQEKKLSGCLEYVASLIEERRVEKEKTEQFKVFLERIQRDAMKELLSLLYVEESDHRLQSVLAQHRLIEQAMIELLLQNVVSEKEYSHEEECAMSQMFYVRYFTLLVEYCSVLGSQQEVFGGIKKSLLRLAQNIPQVNGFLKILKQAVSLLSERCQSEEKDQKIQPNQEDIYVVFKGKDSGDNCSEGVLNVLKELCFICRKLRKLQYDSIETLETHIFTQIKKILFECVAPAFDHFVLNTECLQKCHLIVLAYVMLLLSEKETSKKLKKVKSIHVNKFLSMWGAAQKSILNLWKHLSQQEQLAGLLDKDENLFGEDPIYVVMQRELPDFSNANSRQSDTFKAIEFF